MRNLHYEEVSEFVRVDEERVTIYIVMAAKIGKGGEREREWGILEVYVPRLYK